MGHQLAAIANGPLAAIDSQWRPAPRVMFDGAGRYAMRPTPAVGGTLPGAGPIMEVVGPADLVLALNDALIQAISRSVDDWQNPIAIERARFRPFVGPAPAQRDRSRPRFKRDSGLSQSGRPSDPVGLFDGVFERVADEQLVDGTDRRVAR